MFVWSVRDRLIINSMLEDRLASAPSPAVFTPDLLFRHDSSIGPLAKPSFLHVAFHLTGQAIEADSEVGNANPRYPHLELGRPDIAELMDQMANIAMGSRVAVLACGPYVMMEEVRSRGLKYSNFDIHVESFEL